MKIMHAVLLFLILGVLSANSNALMLTMEPSSTLIYENDPVSVDIVISGLDAGGPESLGAFSMDVVWGATVLDYDSIEFGPYLGNPDPLAFESVISVDDSNATGNPAVVSLLEVSLLSSLELDMIQSDSFTLATMNFTGAAPGFTLMRMENVVLSDAFGNVLADPVLVGTGIEVTEPSPLVMFISAALMLGFLISRQSRGQSRISIDNRA